MNAPGGAGVLATALRGLMAGATGESEDTVASAVEDDEQRASFTIVTPLGRYMVEVSELDE